MAEKDYKKIAASRIVRPSQIEKLPRILVYGRNKKGKTTFCTSAGIEQTLIADPERGTTYMKGKDPHTWPIDKWQDLDDLYGYLRMGDHPYKWVALDGLSRFSDMALDYVMSARVEKSIDTKPGMVQLKDWGQAGKVMRTMMVNFYNLTKMGVIFTAQERPMEAIESEADEDVDGGEMAFVADLPKGSRGMINSLVDVIGRIYVAKVDIKGVETVQHRLWLGDHPMYDTGARSEYVLPDYMKNPTVPKLIQLLDEGRITPVRK